MASYLVTGGAGFIGSHLCDALIHQKHKVYVLDNLSTGSKSNLAKEVTFVEGDICDSGVVSDLMEKVDGCFHLAAIVSVHLCNENLIKAHEVNLKGTLNIIEAARTAGDRPVPVVYASSCAVYGDNHNLPVKESEAPLPISLYAALKLAGEHYGRFVSEIYNTSFTALRLFNVYGARQRLDSNYSGVISIFLNNFLQGKVCTVYGDGSQCRDFVYVKDVVLFFIKAMETSQSMRTFNVCTGLGTEINTIATILSNVIHEELKIEFKPAKLGDIYRSFGNPNLAEHELHFKANTPLQDGLTELVESVVRTNR